MPNYIENDFWFSHDGDFLLSHDKDILDTSDSPYRSLFQGIDSRLNFNKGEWPGKNNNIGANIVDFIGKPNTEETGDEIKLRIINSLTQDNFLSEKDLSVEMIPLDENVILAKLYIKVGSTVATYTTKFSLREKTYGRKGKIK